MRAYMRFFILSTALLSKAFSQQGAVVTSEPPHGVRLNVHVSPQKGPETPGLQSKDFTILDNNAVQQIQSFKAVDSTEQPVKVILLIDAVNTDFSRVAYVREQAQKFLKLDSAQLKNPTTIAILTDSGTQIQKEFTRDGNALSASLDHYTIGLREITRSSGIWGADERVDISLRAVRELLAYASALPGRKVLLWISPGWPLLSGPRIELSARQQKQIFANVVAFSNELQQSDLTLYSINPLGVAESLYREGYYENFVKGITTSSETDIADLSLQVLAVQSGGLALNGSNDVVESLKFCVADLQSWYELTIPSVRAERQNEYHHIDIKTDIPSLVSRTRDGYYAQP